MGRFPFDTVKIDKSFIDGVADSGDDAAFVEAILALGGTMNMQTLAEGIESAEQADTLKALHCGLGQGFYFAKPLEAAAVDSLLDRLSTPGASWPLDRQAEIPGGLGHPTVVGDDSPQVRSDDLRRGQMDRIEAS